MSDAGDEYKAMKSFCIKTRNQRKTLATLVFQSAGVEYTEPTSGVFLIRVGRLKINYFPNKHRATVNSGKSQHLSPEQVVEKIRREQEMPAQKGILANVGTTSK